MKNMMPRPITLILVALLGTTGCQQVAQQRDSDGSTSAQADSSRGRLGGTSQQTSQHRPVDATAPRAAASTARATHVGCSESTDGLINLSKSMPAEAGRGAEFMAQVDVTALSCAGNVVVRDTIPDGATYVRSEPEATVDGQDLVWKIGTMDAGQTINAKVWLRADREGSITSCAVVSADPRACASTFVGTPTLVIEKTGPATANLGSDVTYNIVVRNTGSAVARNVVVTDPAPNGMTPASRQETTFDVGDLGPGQASRPLSVTFKANERGQVCNTATASSGNAERVSAEACTNIVAPGLKVEKSGTTEQILGRNADYVIVVTNTGDTVLTEVEVTDTAPAETSIVAAPGGSVRGNKATWTIAQIQPGAQSTVNLTLTSKTPGNHCNSVTASSGPLSESAQACTVWRGIAAILLEVVDDPDPIQVGETTTYTIKVTNQGFADIHNMKIEAAFDDEVTPTNATQGTISGSRVSFPSVAILGAKDVTTYTITVRGASAGDARNKVTLTSDELQTSVEETESTTVY